MAEDEAKLTVKERRFADAYLGEAAGNGTEAARIAGYSAKSYDALRQQASQTLTKPHVRAYIDSVLMAEAMTPAEILHELRDVGTAEWRDFISVRTNPKTGEVIEVKMDLSAKMKALELNGKYHKMFVDVGETNGSHTVFVREYREGVSPLGNTTPRKDEPDGGGL